MIFKTSGEESMARIGVPVVAHGKDLIIGFSEERLSQLLECCRHTSEVPAEV